LLGHNRRELGDEIRLAREIAIDGAGRDARALRDRRNLHCANAALDLRRAGGSEDGVAAGGEAARHALCAAIRHGS
jgi:hypothetical protein